MKVGRFIAPLVAALALLVPAAAANASYTISKRQAELNARDAAEFKYGDLYGISFGRTSASCKPQFVRYDARYNYHRWVCGWAGEDSDSDLAGGVIRITGHTGNSYGYAVLRGISWD